MAKWQPSWSHTPYKGLLATLQWVIIAGPNLLGGTHDTDHIRLTSLPSKLICPSPSMSACCIMSPVTPHHHTPSYPPSPPYPSSSRHGSHMEDIPLTLEANLPVPVTVCLLYHVSYLVFCNLLSHVHHHLKLDNP